MVSPVFEPMEIYVEVFAGFLACGPRRQLLGPVLLCLVLIRQSRRKMKQESLAKVVALGL